ncbi:MAG: hypothetical protein QXQ81_07170 [Candidatus Thorarchaeota archaeon]
MSCCKYRTSVPCAITVTEHEHNRFKEGLIGPLMAQETSQIRSQIEQYFKIMRLKYTWKPDAQCYELAFTERKDGLPVSQTTTSDPQQFNYMVRVKIGDAWIQIFADLCPIDRVPRDRLQELLIDLMRCNREIPEVCFDYNVATSNIGTSQETMVQGLNFDVFRAEFYAVPWAVRYFWSHIAGKYGLS